MKGPELFAVVEAPDFPLQAVRRLERSEAGGPRAVLDESGGRSRVVAADAAARAAGVEAGMNPARALARCGNLRLRVRSPEAEARAERLLLLAALGFAPVVEHSAPGRATCALRGLAADGLQGRAEALVQRLGEGGLDVRIGISDTPDRARWACLPARPVLLAPGGGEALAGLPLEVLELPPGQADVLGGWGVRTLGELARLPRAALGERLGPGGPDLWDRLAGRTVRLLRPFVPAPRFRRAGDFEHRLESLEALLFLLGRFLGELELELRAADAAAGAMRLRLGLEDGTCRSRRVDLPEPSARAEVLLRVLGSALEGARTPSPVASAVLELEAAGARARQSELFGTVMEDAARFGETADRVAALTGPGRSGSPRPEDGWRPDAFRMEKMDTEEGGGRRAKGGGRRAEGEGLRAEGGGRGVVPAPAGLPFRRLRPSQRLRVLLESGRPAAVRADGEGGWTALRGVRGPWRSSGGWWEPGGWSREEWDVERADGGLWRIYRADGGWFLEGEYG